MTEQLRSLADLLDLHQIDRQIDRLLERRAGLPELDAYKAAHKRLQDLEQQRDELAGRVREVGLELDKMSGELELTEDKAHREESRLYAGGMSARDADYLRREVEMLRTKVGEGEEAVLQLMEAKDTAESESAALAKRLESEESAKAQLENSIKQEWKVIDSEVGAKEHRKEEILPLVDPDLVELYEDLRIRRPDDDVVGSLEDGVCGACHLKLSAAEEALARREDPPRCVHCRAVLVP